MPPLPGPGDHLGGRACPALAPAGVPARAAGRDPLSDARLRRWARTRASEAAVAARAFEAIHDAYTSPGLLASLVRGPLLAIAGGVPPLNRMLWRRAAGL